MISDDLIFGYQLSKASITSYLHIYGFKVFDSCIMHTVQMWFWVRTWVCVCCIVWCRVTLIKGDVEKLELCRTCLKAWMGGHMGNVVDCSILADTRT